MAKHFTLKIDEKRFDKIGIEPRFDEDLYDELIDSQLRHAVPDDRRLTVELSPWSPYTTKSRLLGIGRVIVSQNLGDYANFGRHRGRMRVYARPETGPTNKTLLHETSHWLDDVHDDVTAKDMRRQRAKPFGIEAGKRLAARTAAAGAGYGAYELTGSTLVGMSTYGLLLTADLIRGRCATDRIHNELPWEIAADAFASDPERFQRFGQIITYPQLGSWQRYAIDPTGPADI